MESKMPSQAFLDEIKRWKLEAREEDTNRYFYSLQGIDDIVSGECSFVIGRKGSGKTAIAEHIRGLSDYNCFIRSLSFKNFPFNELYKLEDKGFTRPSQYITLWKHVIYTTVCNMMANNEHLDGTLVHSLRQHFDYDFEKALSASITRLTDRAGGFTILGTGANASTKTVIVPNDTPWPARVDALETVIRNHIDESVYYTIFDDLAEDYKDVFDIKQSQQYFRIADKLI
jgi:hypothetical protein